MWLILIHSATACKSIMCTHSKADRPVSGGSNKSRKADTEPPPFLYSICAHCVSWTKFNNSLPLYSEYDKERKTWKGERKKRKKNEGSELSPPLRLLFNTATERGRERARLSKRKSDRGWSPLTKYKAVASEQSQYSTVCVPVQCLVYHRAAN